MKIKDVEQELEKLVKEDVLIKVEKECPDCGGEMIMDKETWWCDTCGHLPEVK